MRIYLIRHGQTTGDVEDRYGGTYDDHLTDLGKQQSEERAKKLAGLGIEAVFASPKIRAQEAAEIIAKHLNLPVATVDDLRERNFYGVLSGMVKSEAREKYPDIVALLKDVHNTLPEGEPYEELGRRITDALRTIARLPYKTVAVVTHGGPISFIFRDLLNKGETKIEDCACITLEADADGGFTLQGTDGVLLATIDKFSWIHIENRKMLFVRTKHNDTLYTPGGKREAGETDEQALIREIKEEVSVDLVPSTIRHLATFKAQAHGKPEGVMVQLTCYAADFTGTLAPASEVEELGWLTSQDEAKTSATGQLTLRWLKEQNLVD